MKTYRMVEKDKYGNLKTLFHGINGSRILPIDTWIQADIKMVSEGVNAPSPTLQTTLQSDAILF